ncbi:hypothetical protein BU17DRAFT_71503 [Hysterangium stoloniferum]|nr:hypothetical protein BU17DRAFT_71503 [Hysterangium stoloniferum]
MITTNISVPDLVAQLDTIFMIHQLIQHWILLNYCSRVLSDLMKKLIQPTVYISSILSCLNSNLLKKSSQEIFSRNLLKTLLNTNKLMVQPTHAVFIMKDCSSSSLDERIYIPDHFGLPEDDEDEDEQEQEQKRRGVRWPFHYLMGGKSESTLNKEEWDGIEVSGQQGMHNHLSENSLLFINACLAAHEDKVPLCVTNLAKIKAELLVDAFLLPDDPPTLAEGE